MQTRNNRRPGWIRAAAFAMAVVVLFAACRRTAPEQQLRQDVAKLQAGIQVREIGPIRVALADDFIGPEGMDRSAAIRLAQVMYLQNQRISAVFGPLQLTLLPSVANPNHATVAFSVALSGGSAGALPDSARLYQVRTGWRLKDGDWQMTSADWTSAL